MNPNSSHIYCNNLIDNYYPNRPNQLENMSLYEFASKYDFKSIPCILNDNNANCIKLENSFGYMHFRNKIAVLKIPFIKPNCYMNQEKYFYQLLLLFKPWRNELNDIYNQSKHLNFKCMFLNEFENQLYNNLFLNEFIECRNRVNNAIKVANELAKNTTDDIRELEEDESSRNYINDLQLNRIIYKECDILDNISKLNNDQRFIFNQIINIVKNQIEYKSNGNFNQSIYKFVTGEGGKSIF